MKLLKAALFTALFSCAGLANAELISNVPLDTSRFELMPISELSASAAQGNNHAQFYLAKRLQKGEGVQPNLQQARLWLEKAAMRGDNRASYTLALLDEKQKNLVDAYKWYDLAARDGMLDEKVRNKARGKIGQLALNLSSADIASARSKADTWFQSK